MGSKGYCPQPGEHKAAYESSQIHHGLFNSCRCAEFKNYTCQFSIPKAKEVRMRRDALPEYRRAGDPEKIAELESEIEILMEYLPQQLSKDEITQLATEVIVSVGADSERDLGKVMGVLMPKVKGRADGKLVNQVVRELLTSGH